MKKQFFVLSTLALVLTACGQEVKSNQPAASTVGTASGIVTPATASGVAITGLDTESKQLSYIIGYEIAAQMGMSQLKQANIELDKQVLFDAMQDQISGKPNKVSQEEAQKIMAGITTKVEAALNKAASEAQIAGEKFLSENKAKDGIKTLASGLQIKTNKEGAGVQVAQGDLVSVEYEGRLTNGDIFDSTKEHGGQPFELPVIEGTVIPGWIEGLKEMKEGGEYTLYIPANLAYGKQSPSPKIPANSVLVFDMKVIKVQKGEGEKRMKQAQAEQEKIYQEAMKQQQGAQKK